MVAANVTNTYVVAESTKVSPYYDDFDEAKNFHRILFRPGYAVQARELTQVQTILQNQIERFGRHIFTNGSPVIGGDVKVPNEGYATINLSPSYANTDITAASFENKTIVLAISEGEPDAARFRVIKTSEATDTDPPSIYGSYLGTKGFDVSTTVKIEGEEVYANIASSNHTSMSRVAILRDSIFFYNGYFVKVPAQVKIIGKYDLYPSIKVGLEFDDTIVTEDSDTSLLDPAQEASNYQAPGAARYKMDLTLSTRSLESSDDSKFVELARVEAGILTKLIKFPVYSEIEEVMARRTYDESGNYTVKPFVINLTEHRIDPENFVNARLSPGKAYIYGYEYETISDTDVKIPKSRTKKSVSDLYLNINYGNYVVVNNLEGEFDTSVMEAFDIHCVPYQSINFDSNTSYQQTKIGTGHVRELEFYGGDVDVTERKYGFYLFDTHFRTISSNAKSATSSTLTIYDDVSLLSTNPESYTRATLRTVSGPGYGYTYNITQFDYDGSNYTITVDPPFFEQIDNTSNVAIEFDFSDSDSFVKHSSYTPGATSNANCNITTINKSLGTANSDTFIFEPSLNNLLFKLPEANVANGITGMSYMYRRKFPTIDFNSGVSDTITAQFNEQFLGTTVTSNVSTSVMENFFVVVTDKKESDRSNGEIVKVTSSITTGNPETAYLETGNTDETFTASIYGNMEFKVGVEPKLKTFVQANTSTLSSETPSEIASSPTGSTANVYLNAGQIVITNPSRKVGVSESLYISDVIGVKKIYDLNGASIEAGAVLADYRDVTERFEFDSGQKDTHYDHASIKLKPDWPSCKGPLVVCCYYFDHTMVSQGGGYFNVDSYPSLSDKIYNEGTDIGYGYDIIPYHKRSNGEMVSLRDCIDFRPARENGVGTNPNYNLYGIHNPLPAKDFLLNYSYYLGRRDLIVLTANRTIERIEGIPSKYPQDPTVPNRVMVLYSLGVPPYTSNPNSVKVKYVDNRRYTMRDIGKIDKRVENLEYYVTLNTLEKKAVDMSITDVNGLERTKYGIFADSFTGHALGASELPDYKCAMNFTEGYLQCQANTTGVTLAVDSGLSSNVVIHRDKVTLKYTETPYITQQYATKDAPVAEYVYAVFDGNIITLPEADIWKSTNVDPDIIVTDTNTTEYTTTKVYQSIVDSQTRV